MIELIRPLGKMPGVLIAALISDDGVPVVAPGDGGFARDVSDAANPFTDPHVLAALSASWMDELARCVGQLSWDSPRRVLLRAARGSLMLLPIPGAVLVVILERGLAPDDLWLAMEGVAARIERHLRSMGSTSRAAEQEARRAEQILAEPAAALPARDPAQAVSREEQSHESIRNPGSQAGN